MGWGASLVSQLVKNLPAMRKTWVWSRGWEDSHGGGHDNPLQYFCLEDPHEQRRLVGYSSCGHRVRQDWATKHRSGFCFVLFCFAYNNPTLKFQYHNGCFFNFGSFVLIRYINSTYSTVNYNMMKKANFLPSSPDTTLTLVLFSSMHLIFIKVPAPVNILHGWYKNRSTHSDF